MTEISRWARPDPEDTSGSLQPPASERGAKAEPEPSPEADIQPLENHDSIVAEALERATLVFEQGEGDEEEEDGNEKTEGEATKGEAEDSALPVANLNEPKSDSDQTVEPGQSTEQEETLSPAAQYILQMRNCLFLFWLPLVANASGCFGGRYLLQSARLQAIVSILTLISPVICLVVTIVMDKKVMRLPASIALALLLVGAMAIGGLSGAFELVGTWTMLTSDKDPNMKQLNAEVVNANTNLVLYDYNPPMKRTMRILRSEIVVFPGVIFAKKQQEKSD